MALWDKVPIASGSPHARLIDRLARGLLPVPSFGSPVRRILGWLLVVGLPGAGLAAVADLRGTLARHAVDPALVLAAVGSIATAVAAAAAAVLATLPDRDPRWALLPLPSLALWIGASVSGAGMDHGVPISLSEACACVGFILGFGIPFALLLAASMKGGYALHPSLSGGLAGLAAASAAASILGLFHPFAMALNDLALHALAVALLSGAGAGLGRRLLRAKP
ncbi:NrsF family protein [Methylobacterium sp. 77]|uniref:NrsF family protein n=1 Tax=Methylobacterium sp. 77 TaxID=1101192 RepID=UPI0003661BB7|nr:NrsF family protein [Methylobacterium sp. 77]